MSDRVLTVSGLSKKYSRRLRSSLLYGLRDIAGELGIAPSASAALREDEFWAVSNVSFEVRRGEAVGVIGHNGAGKSTLLKLLCGLMKPDRGEIRVRGRTEAVIELGTGFNPLLSGRENIALAAALHGYRGRRAQDLTDGAIDFAEIEDFIDVPMQSYSAGMRARLAYAVAAQLEPDLFLIDEVLAVGDAAFQVKCFDHLRSFLGRGGTLLFVSHNITQMMAICRRAILLEHGELKLDGSIHQGVNQLIVGRRPAAGQPEPSLPSLGTIAVERLEVEPVGSDAIHPGGGLRLTVGYRADSPADATWGFNIWTEDQCVCLLAKQDRMPRTIAPGSGELSCFIPRLPLVPGRYFLRMGISSFPDHQPLAMWGAAIPVIAFEVEAPADSALDSESWLPHFVTTDVEWG